MIKCYLQYDHISWGPALVVAITSRRCFPQEELGSITWLFQLFWLREYFEILRDTQESLALARVTPSLRTWQYYNMSEGPTWRVRASSCLWLEGQRCHLAIVFAEWVFFLAFAFWQSHGALKACSQWCPTRAPWQSKIEFMAWSGSQLYMLEISPYIKCGFELLPLQLQPFSQVRRVSKLNPDQDPISAHETDDSCEALTNQITKYCHALRLAAIRRLLCLRTVSK